MLLIFAPNLSLLHLLQKQSSEGILLKKVFLEIYKIHRKTPVPESLF